MKNLWYPLALFCFLLFSNFQCGKEFLCDTPMVESRVTVNLKPEKAEYLIGDTIFLGSGFSTILPLMNSDETRSIENGSCDLGLFIIRLDKMPGEPTKGYSDFEIINLNGELHQNFISDEIKRGYEGTISFECDLYKCGFEIGLVPKVKGNYCLSLYIGHVSARDTSECPENIRFLSNRFDVNSHNREIFQELGIKNSIRLPTSYSTSFYWDIVDSDGAFAFKVK